MHRVLRFVFVSCIAGSAAAAPPELVIYNNDFGVVRDSVPLDLKPGENEIRYHNVTDKLDPGSVILRDPAGKTDLRILEQKFTGEALKQDDMLLLYEGQTLPFRIYDGTATREVQAKIVRASVPERHGGRGGPIVEMNGAYLWDLPGTPMFPRLPEGLPLRPELMWKIAAKEAVKLDAELVFATEGLDWSADYNAVTNEDGSIAQLVGWITITNKTARKFDHAKVKVVAGAVNKVDPNAEPGSATTERVVVTGSFAMPSEGDGSPPAVERKNFDEYHEFALQRPVTLTPGDTTQVEFVRTARVPATRSFVYSNVDLNDATSAAESPILDPQFGTGSNKKVIILTEFKNDAAHQLGAPLPRGRFRFYRDAEQKLQFTGESIIGNTPQNEMVRAVSGNAFDLIGERRQIDFRVNEEARNAEESFEIKLRNHRDAPVEIRVMERTARWRQWEITAKSDEFKKIDARTIEFRVPVKPKEERVVTYTIRYSQFPKARR